MTTTEPRDSRWMLDLAGKMVACGDRRQASMQMWEAAAERVKEISAERGWPNLSRTDDQAIIWHIGESFGERRISDLFALASHARQNSYEDWRTLEEVAGLLERVRELIGLLDEAHRTLPPDLSMPTDSHYRDRHGS